MKYLASIEVYVGQDGLNLLEIFDETEWQNFRVLQGFNNEPDVWLETYVFQREAYVTAKELEERLEVIEIADELGELLKYKVTGLISGFFDSLSELAAERIVDAVLDLEDMGRLHQDAIDNFTKSEGKEQRYIDPILEALDIIGTPLADAIDWFKVYLKLEYGDN